MQQTVLAEALLGDGRRLRLVELLPEGLGRQRPAAHVRE